LHDDLWGQYWLAGVAAGLAYCHKVGLSDQQRLTGLIFAAANLKRYAAAFSLPVPTEVETLHGSDAEFGTESPRRPRGGRPSHNLPAQTTPFVGRAAQIADLSRLILEPDVRLVTLVGPGGTGKTRLSLQVAQDALPRFPDGVFFVPLADDTTADQFVSRVAQQIEVKEGGRPLLENVKDFLRDKRLLLVLDNFEQLVSAGPVLAELLADAAMLKTIVSSRMALQIQAEHEYPVPPLDLPETGELQLEELAGNESVTLFAERARASSPSFALTPANASAVAEICRRLDGLPLALELAAARVKLLPPQAILARLDDRLKLLTGGARDLPSRQQTMRNTLDWSYGLLHEAEKDLYARLSVFVGGFDLEAAEAVCNAEKDLDILEGLNSLMNNSLLRQETKADSEPRFRMLETIRAHALERLAERGEREALRMAHALHYGNIASQASYGLISANALQWLNWVERELDNVRATLSWCLATADWAEVGGMLIFGLSWFWYRRGYFSEGRMWAERAKAVLPAQSISRARAMVLAASGMLALWQGEPERGLAQLQEGLAIVQRLEDEFLVANLLVDSGGALVNMGNDSAAKPLLEESERLFKEQGQKYLHLFPLVHMGNVELGLGNPERARALHEEALTEARAIGENWMLAFALNNLGEVARAQGQYDLARKYYEECEGLLRDTGDRGDMARFAHSLGYIAQHEGDYARAEAQFRKSLTMFRRLGNRRGMAECMAGLAGLKARQGNVEWGAIMLGAAESVLKITGGAWWPADRVEVEANQAVISSALSEADQDAAKSRGSEMTLEQALSFASESA
jgi:predicted ATPase